VSDLFPAVIETERLRLERESVADGDLRSRYESLAADAVDDDELAYVPIEPFAHLADAREYVAEREDRMASGNAGTYVVRPREGEDGAGEPAGETELFALWDERTAFMTLGLRKRFWGRGYSAERAGALLRLAFERLDLEVVSVTHLVANENSRRAIQKYVDRFDGTHVGRFRRMHVIDDDPVHLERYTITQEDYAESGERPDCTFHDDSPDDDSTAASRRDR
jgi:ribosomal-protein-alanine N-acetyltransferase